MLRIQCLAKLILDTSSSSLVNTSLAIEFRQAIQCFVEEQQDAVVGNADAEDLLTKLLYICAPMLRLCESFVRIRI